MKTSEIQSSDTYKIHNEILQLLNQRFTLSTTAISVVCLVLAWIAPKDINSSSQTINIYLYFVTTFLFVLLIILFWVSSNMKVTLRFLSAYLVASGLSLWESEWKEYRKDYLNANKYELKWGNPFKRNKDPKTQMYSNSQTFIFLILGFIVTAYPLFLTMFSLIQKGNIIAWNFHFIMALMYFILLQYLRIRSSDRIESELIQNWQRIIKGRKVKNVKNSV